MWCVRGRFVCGRHVGTAIREQPSDLLAAVGGILGIELDEKNSVRAVGQHPGNGAELGGSAREVDQHVVEHLDRRGVVCEDRFDVFHRFVEVTIT